MKVSSPSAPSPSAPIRPIPTNSNAPTVESIAYENSAVVHLYGASKTHKVALWQTAPFDESITDALTVVVNLHRQRNPNLTVTKDSFVLMGTYQTTQEALKRYPHLHATTYVYKHAAIHGVVDHMKLHKSWWASKL